MASLVASFEGLAAAGGGAHLGAEQLHPPHVQRLALDVLGAHVHDAIEPEERAHGRCGDAVLAGAGLGDDAPLAHPPREQQLPDGVVDLVRAGVAQVLALQVDARAEVSGEALAERQRRRAPDVRAEEVVVLGLEALVGPGLGKGRAEVFEDRDEDFGDEGAAVVAEPAARVGGAVACGGGECSGHVGSGGGGSGRRRGEEAKSRGGQEPRRHRVDGLSARAFLLQLLVS